MNPEEMKELQNALVAVREATASIEDFKQQNKGISELELIVEKSNKTLDELEEKNQADVKRMAEERKKREEMEEKVKDLEVKLAKVSTMGAGFDDRKMELANELKNLKLFAEGGEKLKQVEKKYMRSDSGTEGGFLMTEAYDDMIIKPITEISPMRQVCRVKKIDAFTMNAAARNTLTTSYWTGEGEDFTESNSTYRSPKIPTHSLTTLSKATTRALLGGRWDIQSEITGDMVESRAQKEGAAFVNGTGAGQPTGFMATASAVPSYNSGDAATYDFDALINLTGQLKAGYSPMYGMNRKELAFMRTLTDGLGNYVWRAGNLGAGVPNQINGEPYIIIPDMPDKGAGAFPVIYADFMKLYTIVDSFNALFLRNPYKEDGYVQFTTEGWIGGQVVLAEAGVRLKCST